MIESVSKLATKLNLNPAVWAEKDEEAAELGWYPGHPAPKDPLRWGQSFPEGAKETLQNTQMRRNLGFATRKIREKRNERVEEMPDWEELREAASAIKRNVAARFPELLEEFEKNVIARGGIVHWARDAQEANEIAYSLIKAKGVDDDPG